MKIWNKYLIFLFLFILTSCYEPIKVIDYDFGLPDYLKNTQRANINFLKNIEGIYEMEGPNNSFGKRAVIKSFDEYITIYGENDGLYMIMRSGVIDNMVRFAGYYRYPFQITSYNVFAEANYENLSKLDTSIKPIEFELKISINRNFNKEFVYKLKYVKPLWHNDAYIIAHRGGGRNSDFLPFSENSIELMRFSQLFGANSVEIDVQSSKDRIPFIYHDYFFSSRLLNSDFLIGPTQNFTFKEIKSFGKLKNGEEIPSLDEALNAIVNETQLKLVWVDCKSDLIVNEVVEIIKKYNNLAMANNRDIKICFGIPTEAVYNKYLAIENRDDIYTICELSVNHTQIINSLAYAPSWTLGILDDESKYLRSMSKKLFVWTLDENTFARKFIKSNAYDGYVTNFPSIIISNCYLNANE